MKAKPFQPQGASRMQKLELRVWIIAFAPSVRKFRDLAFVLQSFRSNLDGQSILSYRWLEPTSLC